LGKQKLYNFSGKRDVFMNTKIFIYFYSFFFFCSLNAYAQNITRNASADLDGDGKQDSIYLSIDSKGKYILKINDISRLSLR